MQKHSLLAAVVCTKKQERKGKEKKVCVNVAEDSFYFLLTVAMFRHRQYRSGPFSFFFIRWACVCTSSFLSLQTDTAAWEQGPRELRRLLDRNGSQATAVWGRTLVFLGFLLLVWFRAHAVAKRQSERGETRVYHEDNTGDKNPHTCAYYYTFCFLFQGSGGGRAPLRA